MKNEITRKDLFFCFDPRLSNFLYSKGIRFILEAYHNSTGKKFFLYSRTIELSKAIEEYNTMKSTYENNGAIIPS